MYGPQYSNDSLAGIMFVYDENDSAYTEPWLMKKLREFRMRKATPSVQLQVVHGGLYEETGYDLQRQAA